MPTWQTSFFQNPFKISVCERSKCLTMQIIVNSPLPWALRCMDVFHSALHRERTSKRQEVVVGKLKNFPNPHLRTCREAFLSQKTLPVLYLPFLTLDLVRDIYLYCNTVLGSVVKIMFTAAQTSQYYDQQAGSDQNVRLEAVRLNWEAVINSAPDNGSPANTFRVDKHPVSPMQHSLQPRK